MVVRMFLFLLSLDTIHSELQMSKYQSEIIWPLSSTYIKEFKATRDELTVFSTEENKGKLYMNNTQLNCKKISAFVGPQSSYYY